MAPTLHPLDVPLGPNSRPLCLRTPLAVVSSLVEVALSAPISSSGQGEGLVLGGLPLPSPPAAFCISTHGPPTSLPASTGCCLPTMPGHPGVQCESQTLPPPRIVPQSVEWDAWSMALRDLGQSTARGRGCDRVPRGQEQQRRWQPWPLPPASAAAPTVLPLMSHLSLKQRG